MPPTPLLTPPIKAFNRFQTISHVVEINRMTAATQWAIDTHQSTTPETKELPHHYHQHWWVFSKKLAQHFPPARKNDHAIKLHPGVPDTIPSCTYK
jgi:hypothetical protein